MEENERVSRVQLMKLLVACLYFAQSYRSGLRIRVNTLDVALKTARKRGAFPPWGKKNLHFANGRLRTVCIELEELLNLAFDCGCIEYDPPFCFMRIATGPRVALQFLREIGVGKKKARRWGRFIREALEELEKEQREIQSKFHKTASRLILLS